MDHDQKKKFVALEKTFQLFNWMYPHAWPLPQLNVAIHISRLMFYFYMFYDLLAAFLAGICDVEYKEE